MQLTSRVSEIKVIFCALTGCTSPKSVHPGFSPCSLLICSNDKLKKNNVLTPGAHLRKSCTRPRKCVRRAQGAPLISDTEVLGEYDDKSNGLDFNWD